MAGGGVKPGVYGETDEFGYNIASNPVHVHDFHATILDLMGLNHEQLVSQTPWPPLSAHRCRRQCGQRPDRVNK